MASPAQIDHRRRRGAPRAPPHSPDKVLAVAAERELLEEPRDELVILHLKHILLLERSLAAALPPSEGGVGIPRARALVRPLLRHGSPLTGDRRRGAAPPAAPRRHRRRVSADSESPHLRGGIDRTCWAGPRGEGEGDLSDADRAWEGGGDEWLRGM